MDANLNSKEQSKVQDKVDGKCLLDVVVDMLPVFVDYDMVLGETEAWMGVLAHKTQWFQTEQLAHDFAKGIVGIGGTIRRMGRIAIQDLDSDMQVGNESHMELVDGVIVNKPGKYNG